MRFRRAISIALLSIACGNAWAAKPDDLNRLIQDKCIDCHSGETSEGGLNLDTLAFDLLDPDTFQTWVRIHDRIRDGEMPPPDSDDDGAKEKRFPIGWTSSPNVDSTNKLATKLDSPYAVPLRELAAKLLKADQNRIRESGRAGIRRLNRYEYENKLRQVLDAPWLQVVDQLPEDSVDHLYNKIADRLDVSHVQMSRYLAVAREALEQAVNAAAHQSTTRKFYAREEGSMHGFVRYHRLQSSATRAIVPLLGDPREQLTSELDVIRGKIPMSVGSGAPEKRELEAMGTFCGTFKATTKYDFSRINAPTGGDYRIRFKTYTFRAGPDGASGGQDDGLTGGSKAWWRPNRNTVKPGARSEPVTLYALHPSGASRRLVSFDSHPDPSVFECNVTLRRGEGIRPDAGRLVRTRPGWHGNPNATRDGIPGFAMQWMEVTGPLNVNWPPPSYMAVFGDLPFTANGRVKVDPKDPAASAKSVIDAFYSRIMAMEDDADANRDEHLATYLGIYDRSMKLGQDFTDAMISTLAAMLCSPDFLYLDTTSGKLTDKALAERKAYFLWNGPPDRLTDPVDLKPSLDDMLRDPRSDQFISSFLDYWLDLRDINANAPDADLYPDYYLDDLLTESSVLETRAFFRHLIDEDLPVATLVDSDFAFVNERLADHYEMHSFEGVGLRKIDLPPSSPRGGLLTQASILRVTANGTTTSPVIRGSWIAERLLGMEIPAPPSGVAAIDPDIRGAKTVREQLQKHRAIESCAACHERFDPIGFAMESFDVAGGWRDRYRSIGNEGEAAKGLGKNGHAFAFRWAQPVDCQGELSPGAPFADVNELKKLLIRDQRRLARNLLQQFAIYATGTPMTFADRREIETMLDEAQPSQYGVRTLISLLLESRIFKYK